MEETKNQKYERKKRQRGLEKFTAWAPVDDIKYQCALMCENKDLKPGNLRSKKLADLLKAHKKSRG